MNKYKYSAKNNAFFPADENKEYTDAGWILDDLVDVSDEVFSEFTQDRNSEGLMRGSDKKGYPKWIPVTPKTKEQLIADAEAKKQYLIAEVHTETEMLRTKLVLKRIKPDEEALLNAWLDYLEKLEAVDVSTASDITWPKFPNSELSEN